MKLEIKLKDPKYCDGCRLLDYTFDEQQKRRHYHCQYYTTMEMDELKTEGEGGYFGGELHIIRPRICIKQNGK